MRLATIQVVVEVLRHQCARALLPYNWGVPDFRAHGDAQSSGCFETHPCKSQTCMDAPQQGPHPVIALVSWRTTQGFSAR